MIIANRTKLFLSLGACLLMVSVSAHAEEVTPDKGVVMDMPTLSNATPPEEMTDPILRMMPDKSEMVKLDQEAASVIVGNPNHISVLLDTPNTLVVVPRAEGASYFTVIGKDGSVIMQRHVIVGAAKEQYVRIRRSCSAGAKGCQPTSVYFCPDMCHEVKEDTGKKSSSGFNFSF